MRVFCFPLQYSVRHTGFALAKDKRNGRSRGFGYCTFEDQEKVDAALSALNASGIMIEGKGLKFDLSEPMAEVPAPTLPPRVLSRSSIFVGNLDFSITSEQILEMCEGLMGPGAALSCRIAVDRDLGEC